VLVAVMVADAGAALVGDGAGVLGALHVLGAVAAAVRASGGGTDSVGAACSPVLVSAGFFVVVAAVVASFRRAGRSKVRRAFGHC
jgi:hypothetical protein